MQILDIEALVMGNPDSYLHFYDYVHMLPPAIEISAKHVTDVDLRAMNLIEEKSLDCCGYALTLKAVAGFAYKMIGRLGFAAYSLDYAGTQALDIYSNPQHFGVHPEFRNHAITLKEKAIKTLWTDVDEHPGNKPLTLQERLNRIGDIYDALAEIYDDNPEKAFYYHQLATGVRQNLNQLMREFQMVS